MTRERERKEKARVIPEKIVTGVQLAEIAVRPLRLAFLVDVQTSQEQLRKYIAFCTSIWGGATSFFIPVDGVTIADEWRVALQRFDPDKIIFCDEAQTPLADNIADQVQPFKMWLWSDSVIQDHQHGFDSFGSILVRYLLQHLYDEVRPTQSTNLYVPKYADDSILNLCMAARLGIVEEDVIEFYDRAMKAEVVELKGESLGSYLQKISRADSRISPLQITTHGLSRSFGATGGVIGTVLVVLSRKSPIDDFCIYWNLRATEEMGSKGIVLVPEAALDSEIDLRILGDWCNDYIKGTNALTLVSAGMGVDKLITLKDQIRQLLQNQILIDVWHSGFHFGWLRVHESPSTEEIRTTGREIRLRIPKPSWLDGPRSGMEWVVDLQLQDYSRLGIKYIPPRFPRLNHLLDGEPDWGLVQINGYRIRSTQGFLSLRASGRSEYVSFALPDNDRLFRALLLSKEFQSTTTDKCRYASGMVKLLGGYEKADIFQIPGVRELFIAMHDGAVLTLSEMNRYLKQGGQANRYQQIEMLVSELSLNGIFLRGYQLLCPVCDLRRWYSLDEISETMKCAGCLAELQPPLEAPFSYRLNELFARGIEQGSLPLLLSILLASTLGNKSFLFSLGLEVTKDGQAVDLDALVACDGHLVVIESKDLRAGHDAKTVTEIEIQLKTVVAVAHEIGSKLVILATMLDEVPIDLVNVIDALRHEFTETAINVATRADLERGYFISGEGKPIRIEDLIPKRRDMKSGWIREPGQKFAGIP